MSFDDVLDLCRERQIELWCDDGGQLRYRAPAGALDADLAARIKAERDAFVRFLQEGTWRSDPVRQHERFALTPVQAAYVLGRHESFEFGGNACHLYVEYGEPADLDCVRFEAAWNACVARHPMLRAIVEDNAWQRVLPDVPWQPLAVHDLRDADATAFDAHISRVRERLDHAVHALDHWPVLQPEVSLGPDGAVLHLSVDFTLIDYASLQLLLAEWRRRYDDPQWRPALLDATFRDYVVHEAHARERADHARDKAWWLARIDDLPARPDLPVLPAPGGDARPRFTHRHARLDRAQWAALCASASRFGLSAASVALAAFAEIVGRWSQSPAFCVNLTVLNRPPVHPRIDAVLGDFTALSLLAVDATQGCDFVERARTIGARMFDDLDHRAFTGVDVMRELARRRGKDAALMPVVFTSGIGSVGRLLGEQTTRAEPPRYMISQTPQVWLDCQVTDQFGGLEIGWDVRDDLFPDGMPAAMFDAYVALLGRLADDAECWSRAGDIVLPSAVPVALAHPDADTHIAAGFAAQALRTPDAPVVIDAQGARTYRHVAQHAAALRTVLEQQGVTVGDTVAVLMPKCAHQLAAVLAIVQAGAAYVPVDSRQPALRQQAILRNARVRAVVTLQGIDIEHEGCTRIDIDTFPVDPQWPPRVARDIAPDALAYVIYTSGSTGEPKGVMLSHAAVCNTLADISARHEVGTGDVVLGLAELSFDLSVYDFFGATARGACIVLPDPARGNDPSHWAELMARHHVTLWNSVPAQGQMLIDYLEGEPALAVPGPRRVLWSGDWIPVTLPARWWRRWPDSALFSLGGATEASIWSIEHPIRPQDTQLASIPYGRALTGQTMEVLDTLGRPCPPGVRGEIHIGGVGLASGYANDPARTAERFIRHRDGRRLYRTGDLGRVRADGSLEFLGRQDDQVKIRGYRIELAEIDAALNAHPLVGAATTIVLGEGVERRLASFVSLHGTEPASPEQDDTLNEIAAHVREAFDAARWPAHADVSRSVAQLEAACVASLAGWIVPAGGLMADTSTDLATLCERLRMPVTRQHLLRHWLAMLCANGVLHADDEGGWRVRPDADHTGHADAHASWNAFAHDAPPDLWPAVLIDYFRDSAGCLDAQVDGSVSPAGLMFPEGASHIADAMYSNGEHARALHRGMAQAVRAIVAREPQRAWRILEIGAGTAAATRAIVDALAPLVEAGTRIDYLFSDVSSYFLAAARERFAAYPWMRFVRFDMNAPLDAQGIAPHSVDLTISSGALNNARDTVALIAGLRTLSAPDAWWVIQELTAEHPEISISQALMMETPDDARASASRLFVPRAQWLEWLQADEGDRALGCVAADTPLDALGYDILLAHVKRGAARIAPDALLAFVAERVPGYMVPSQLRVLERLPVTANGKIDRRTLADIADIREPEPAAVRPAAAQASDPLLARLIGLWETVLDTRNVAPDQDFFAAGGDSLLIAQLVSRLRSEEPLAQAHPFDRLLRWVLAQPTPAAFAQCLRDADTASPATPAAPRTMQASTVVHAPAPRVRADVRPIPLAPGDGVPRVIVHEGLGTVHAYRPVMPALARLGPVLGFAVRDAQDYLDLPARHLNATLGRRYADALWRAGVREVDVLGYCSGGLVALDMAKSLVQLGVAVRTLDIVSSYRIPYLIEDERLVLFNFAATLGLPLDALGFPETYVLADALADALKADPARLAPGSLQAQLEIFGDRCEPLDALRARVLRAAAGLSMQDAVAHPLLDERERLYRLFMHSVQASHWAGDAPYAGALRLFVPERCNPLIPQQRAALTDYWTRQALGGITAVDIPGGHFDCLNAAFVDTRLKEAR
ncbi:non-ribosomal peptide synthetase [Burkholderia stabilis]|uniref:Phenyloxazoline synthase MbtB,enterobactin synthase subunit F,Anthranilate/para-aminobenzoate synthases component I,amino acid adenylation domain,AMP-binding enzyme n=1 Tax=Burkholderia stabilis TaxID=95485 RepID=A0AAJ5T6Q8_9BURK|nr:non-ribosomal peptide synthetase [Burkholderia stabilis]VBB14763.1 Phenyloxazoline synthase MbtB,enterobactin synthase subunit F,Anthranilate/para-aminobenzoate synthases component I,amino acid adenylation domain,AMP-binding enzyme [Burkholderia stabilis]